MAINPIKISKYEFDHTDASVFERKAAHFQRSVDEWIANKNHRRFNPTELQRCRDAVEVYTIAARRKRALAAS